GGRQMDRTRPQNGKRALGVNASEPVSGRSQTSDPAYAMPSKMAPGSSALQRVVDDARDAALQGPNPHEFMVGTNHRVAAFRPIGDFDGKSRPVHTIFNASVYKVL